MEQTQYNVSIIIPVYNAQKFLDRCVLSVLEQTLLEVEVILVDDGSPDGCGKICDAYAQRDNRVVVIHKENGGLSDARNAGIKEAKGEWLSFIDSDDFITPDYIDTLYSLCRKYNCKMSVADWQIYMEGHEPILSKIKTYDVLLNKRQALEDMFNQIHFDVSACVKLYHRSLFEGVRYPVGVLFEDLQTTFRLMLKCDNVAYTNKRIYFYMFRSDSIEGSSFSREKMNSAISVFNIMKSYELELQEVAEALKSKLVSFCFHLILKMPKEYKEGEILYEYIKENRWSVLRNNQTRNKTRLACLASYLGFNVVKLLFSLVDRRKNG